MRVSSSSLRYGSYRIFSAVRHVPHPLQCSISVLFLPVPAISGFAARMQPEQKRIPRRIEILVFHIGSFRNQRFPDSPGCLLFRRSRRIQGNVCTVDPSRTRFPEHRHREYRSEALGIRAKLLCGTDLPTCFIGKAQIALADIQQTDTETRHVILSHSCQNISQSIFLPYTPIICTMSQI